MGDTILGIPVPGAPPGNPDVLRSAQPIWHAMGDEINGALDDFMAAMGGLDWNSTAGTAFSDRVAHVRQQSRGDIQNFHAFGDALKGAGDRIDEAQMAYNASIAAATAAAAIGLGATFFTFGASDAAAAAEVAVDIDAIVTEEGLLQLFMNGLRTALMQIIQNFIRNFITQMIVNVVSQEVYSVADGKGLTAPNIETALVYSTAFSLIPGGGLLKTVVGSAGADALAQEVITGHLSLNELLLTAGTAGLFHVGGDVISGLRTPDEPTAGRNGDPAEIPANLAKLNDLVAEADSLGIATGADAVPLSPEQAAQVRSAAETAVATAEANAPQIRSMVQRVAGETGGDIPQTVQPDGSLSNEVKTVDSVIRKVSTEVAADPTLSPSDVTAGMKDTVRYTITYPTESFTGGVDNAMTTLKADGYTPVSDPKHVWGPDSSYSGTNSFWHAPNGQIFELQFHTTESYGLKMATHDAYDYVRLPQGSMPPALQQQMLDVMRQLNNAVPAPPNVASLGRIITF